MAASITSSLRRSLAVAGIASLLALGLAAGAEAAPAKLLKISNVLSQSKSISISTKNLKPKAQTANQVAQANGGISITTSNTRIRKPFDWVRCQYGQSGYCPSPN